jgi:hypothetical protein
VRDFKFSFLIFFRSRFLYTPTPFSDTPLRFFFLVAAYIVLLIIYIYINTYSV